MTCGHKKIIPLPFDRYNRDASLGSSIMEFAPFSHRFPKEERGKEMRNFVVKFPLPSFLNGNSVAEHSVAEHSVAEHSVAEHSVAEHF